jgi:hypothetical protein
MNIFVGILLVLIIVILLYLNTFGRKPCYDGFGDILGDTGVLGGCLFGNTNPPDIRCYNKRNDVLVEPNYNNNSNKWECDEEHAATNLNCVDPSGNLAKMKYGECEYGACLGLEGDRLLCSNSMGTPGRPSVMSNKDKCSWYCDPRDYISKYRLVGCTDDTLPKDALDDMLFEGIQYDEYNSLNNCMRGAKNEYKYFAIGNGGADCYAGNTLLNTNITGNKCSADGYGDPIGNLGSSAIYEIIE